MNKYLEVEYLRVIAVTLIVTWHCFFCPILVWGCITPSPDLPLLHIVKGLLISDAAMPLFTFISGYLFSALFSKGKYWNAKDFILKKANRLLVPFFVLGALVIITTYKTPVNGFKGMIYGEGSHLWFCAMLFWCFVMDWFFKRFKKIKYLSLLLIFYSCYLIYNYPNFWYIPFELPLGVDNAIYYYSYFAMGGAVFLLRDSILNTFKNREWLVLILYFVLYLIEKLHIDVFSDISCFLRRFVYCFVLWLYVVKLIKLGSLKENDKVHQFCRNSFGIYVFHHWIAWIIVWTPYFTNLLREHYLLFPIVLWCIVFLLSYYVTELLLKTKLGRYLLL